MTYTMNTVYAKLTQMGLGKKAQIKKYLPDWWQESIANTEAGFQETLWLITNTFSLDYGNFIASLGNDTLPTYRLSSHYFKHSKNLETTKLQPAVAIATLSAKLTLSVFDKQLADLSHLTPQRLRAEILALSHEWVDFKALSGYCWQLGIPVIFIDSIPSPKMDGLAFLHSQRPVIVLTKKTKYGSLVFDLAHELGHILLGHVQNNGLMLDEKIITNDKNDSEATEQEATQFAVELLTENLSTDFLLTKTYSPPKLASLIIETAKAHQIDPLHLILRYGYETNNHPYAKKVMQNIVDTLAIQATDQTIAKKLYRSYVDIDELADEEVLSYILGIDVE